MDIRIRRLRAGDKSDSLSHSFPSSRPSCFQQCLDSSTDSIPDSLHSPKFVGQYRKLPTHSECDVCQNVNKDSVNLKCLHTFCPHCIETHSIFKNGCPVCVSVSADIDDSDDKPDDSSADEDFIFGNNENEGVILEELIDTLELDVLRNVETKRDAVKKEIDRLNHDIDKEIGKVREYAQNLKILIDQRAEAMIKSATESHTRHCEELSRQMKTLEDFIASIRQCIEEHRHNVHWLTMTDIETKRTAENRMKNLLKLSQQVTEENVHIKFNSKPLNDATVELMGKVGVRVFLSRPLTVNLCKTFQFPGAVHSICPVNNRHAWIGYRNFIQLCSKTGSHGSVIDVGEDVHDICDDGRKNLLIACHSSIKRYDVHGRLTTLFNCDETPRGITCKENGHLVVCIGSNVITFTQDGKQVSVFEKGAGVALKMPYKVSINVNGDICVSDYQSVCGEVVVFESSGKPKTKLRTEGMAPRGLVCNMQGIMYITDFRSDRVNLYSTHGHFLQTLVSASEHSVSGPLSVALDACGDLWIGDWKRKVRIYTQTASDSCVVED